MIIDFSIRVVPCLLAVEKYLVNGLETSGRSQGIAFEEPGHKGCLRQQQKSPDGTFKITLEG